MDLEREIELIFNKVGLDGRKQTQKEVIALFYKYTQAQQLLQTDVSKCVYCENKPYKKGAAYCERHMASDDYS